jgi:hypothetical protein
MLPAPKQQSLRSKIRQDLKNILFTGIVNIFEPKQAALAVAAEESSASADRLIYWTDASGFDTTCGIGIACYSSRETWTQFSWRIRKLAPTGILEAYAITKALEAALDQCRDQNGEQVPRSVVIYSDNLETLRLFDQFRMTLVKLRKQIPNGETLIGPGILAAKSLKDLGIEGNMIAHRAARRGYRQGMTQRKGFSLLTRCLDDELTNFV